MFLFFCCGWKCFCHVFNWGFIQEKKLVYTGFNVCICQLFVPHCSIKEPRNDLTIHRLSNAFQLERVHCQHEPKVKQFTRLNNIDVLTFYEHDDDEEEEEEEEDDVWGLRCCDVIPKSTHEARTWHVTRETSRRPQLVLRLHVLTGKARDSGSGGEGSSPGKLLFRNISQFFPRLGRNIFFSQRWDHPGANGYNLINMSLRVYNNHFMFVPFPSAPRVPYFHRCCPAVTTVSLIPVHYLPFEDAPSLSW